jgi:hypothetical protein
MLPATTPEQIDAVLRAIGGRYELTPSRRRFPLLLLIAANGIAAAILIGAAWAARESGLAIFLGTIVVAVLIETAYKVMKLYRVTEIAPAFVEYRWPLRFLSWRMEASEIRRLDIEHGQREDLVRLSGKTSRNRSLPIPLAVSARIRRSASPPAASKPAPPPA